MTLRTGGTLLTPPAGTGGGGGGTDPGALQKAANLGDVPNKPAARGNMGLGTASTHPIEDFDLTGDAAAAASAAMATAIATADAYADANKARRLTPTAVQVGAYAAVNGDLVVCDATGASFAVQLPAAPANGTSIGVLMVGTAAGHTVTIAAGGADVIDSAGTVTLTLRLPSSLKVLTYAGGTWYTAGGNLSLTQLDNRFDPLGAATGVDKLATDRWMQIQGTARRSMPPALDELAAVAFQNVDTFVSWLTQGGSVVPGCIGELGIPANPVQVDIFDPGVQELIATTRGVGPANIESGRWAQLLEAVLRYTDDQVTTVQPIGLPVLGWECRETTAVGLSMAGPDPIANVAAPLAITYPAGRVLIDHVNRVQMTGVQPFHGVAMSAGMDGFTDTSALTRGADSRPFSVATPGPALGSSYCYGRPESYQFLARLGIRFVRLVFRGERLFNDDNTLNAVELGRLDDAITAAKAAGVFVTLDWHAGASRYFDNGLGDGGLVRRSMGQADGTAAQPLVFDQTFFATAWGRLASHYSTAIVGTVAGGVDPNNPGIPGRGDLRSNVVQYELMNEPAIYAPGSTNAIVTPDMAGRTIWQNCSLAAARTIRALDATVGMLVQAYGGGSAASSFWDYHTAGGVPNHWITLAAGGVDTRAMYAMHTYFDSAGSGQYPDTYELTRQARAAQGYTAKPVSRPVGILQTPHGSSWCRTMATGVAGTPGLGGAGVLTGDVYKCPTNRVAIITDVNFSPTGAAGSTLRVFARPVGTTNASAVNAAWERARLKMDAAPGLKAGPIFLGPDDRLDMMPSVAGVTATFTVYEMPIGRLKVVSLLGVPAGDHVLYTAGSVIPTVTPVTTKGRVCNSGAIANPTAFGWGAFNGAAVAANITGKIKKSGAGAATSCGPALQTPATAHCLGPANVCPGVPSNLIDAWLDPGDQLIVSSDQAGLNVWALIEELG